MMTTLSVPPSVFLTSVGRSASRIAPTVQNQLTIRLPRQMRVSAQARFTSSLVERKTFRSTTS